MNEKTRTSQSFEYIRERIVDGTFLPGKKLAVVSLAQEIHVGPTPIREALSRLAQTGLVEGLDNQGFRVAYLSEEEVRDLYRTFYQIEDLALAQSIDLGDEEWASQIVATLYPLSLVEKKPFLTAEKYPSWAERNQRFHRALVDGCHSPCLLNIRDQLFVQFDRYIRLALRDSLEPFPIDHHEHSALAEAALKRDKALARRLLEEQSFRGIEEMILKLKSKQLLKASG